jgi:hypothetical protein
MQTGNRLIIVDLVVVIAGMANTLRKIDFLAT